MSFLCNRHFQYNSKGNNVGKKRLRPENVNKTSDFDSYFQLPDKLWLVCLEDGDIVVNFGPMLLGHAF